ncbi:NUDIX hydrolase domain [Dillenia turbinata]|uniref:NUDIX hydrolase domain n=1 Tax=Dillenia turbinata TaxID=194707 RepID=A0AAN8ZCX2_9MAGN
MYGSLVNGESSFLFTDWPMISQYGGHILHGESSSNQEVHACLLLGLTDYRTFVGTKLNPLWEKFLVPSEDESAHCLHTANPLGNSAVVETADGKIIVLQRSNNVGEFAGHFMFPGGHPENHDLTATCVNEMVSQEMFDSIIREVVEEIGVPASSLSDPNFIGISQRVLNVRPAAFFYIKCRLQSAEIQHLYTNAQDGQTQLYAVAENDLGIMGHKMPGCHRGGLALYKLMNEVVKDA